MGERFYRAASGEASGKVVLGFYFCHVEQIGWHVLFLHLVAHSRITAGDIFQMGTTDPHKMLTRMRRLGLLYSADNTEEHVLVTNRSGHGRHRVQRWTGRLPKSWVRPERELRFRSRGNR